MRGDNRSRSRQSGPAHGRAGDGGLASLAAYVRHVFTEYDALLEDGYDPDSARHFVLDDINAVLEGWGVRRRLGEGE